MKAHPAYTGARDVLGIVGALHNNSTSAIPRTPPDSQSQFQPEKMSVAKDIVPF